MAVQTLPPVPYKTPMADNNGLLNQIWTGWFSQLFLRVGGVAAPSNNDFATLVNLQSEINVLQTSIISLQSQITDLNQGRIL